MATVENWDHFCMDANLLKMIYSQDKLLGFSVDLILKLYFKSVNLDFHR